MFMFIQTLNFIVERDSRFSPSKVVSKHVVTKSIVYYIVYTLTVDPVIWSRAAYFSNVY